MKHQVTILIFLIFSLSNPAWSQNESEHSHDHGAEEDTHSHEKEKSDHKDSPAQDKHDKEEHGHEESEEGHEHGHGDEHGEEEGGSNVGPDKGIVAASEKEGFKLSPEALKNFEIRTSKLQGSGPWTIPLSARLLSGEEVNLYRLRDGFFKRIDFTTAKKTQDQLTISSSDLKAGDEIVVNGIGFLRIAELAAFGGVAHGHSH